MVTDFSEGEFIVEVESEDTRVVVSALGRFSVLSASVVAEFSSMVAKSFEELLNIRLVEAPETREVIVGVGERDEAILFVKLRFVHASHCPLS